MILDVYLDAEPFITFIHRQLQFEEDPKVRDSMFSLMYRSRQRGKVPEETVDRWCTKFGYHPSAVYGRAWELCSAE